MQNNYWGYDRKRQQLHCFKLSMLNENKMLGDISNRLNLYNNHLLLVL